MIIYGLPLQSYIGVSYPPANVTAFQAQAENGGILLTWNDPEDTVINNATLAIWVGTKVVRKLGGYPTTENDGVLVVDNTIRGKYKTNGFYDEEAVSGFTYYYQAFPYTGNGSVNRYEQNRVKIEVE